MRGRVLGIMFFFFNDTATTEIYTLSLHDALPIYVMHVGGICTSGIFCSVTGGNRDLADSISISIDRGGSASLVWTDQGSILHGPTHITYGCVSAGQSAIVGADRGLSCKGPAGP